MRFTIKLKLALAFGFLTILVTALGLFGLFQIGSCEQQSE